MRCTKSGLCRRLAGVLNPFARLYFAPSFAIVSDDAVANVDYAMRILRDVMLMGYENDGIALRMQVIH